MFVPATTVAKDGSVIQGPASSPLETYSSTISGKAAIARILG